MCLIIESLENENRDNSGGINGANSDGLTQKKNWKAWDT